MVTSPLQLLQCNIECPPGHDPKDGMLYNLYEFQRSLLKPMAAFAELGAYAWSEGPLASLPFAERMYAGYELFARIGKHYDKPAFGLNDTTLADGSTVAVREVVTLAKPFCNLLHFERALPAGRTPDPVVLVVAPLSGHHATLLRDTVRQLLHSHDVYITDWVDARLVPLSKGSFGLDDYVHYVQEFLRLLGPNLHVLSVCQPTVPVLAAISLMSTQRDPKLPRTMTLMGGPIDTRRSPTKVNALATRKSYAWFENTVICSVPEGHPGYLRRVYPGFLQLGGFVAMNPDKHFQSHWDYYKDLIKGDDESAEAHRRFYDEYNAVLDMPAEYYLDTIKVVFQEHSLPKGTWYIDGVRVAPEDITKVPLLTIEGELDDISGSGQTQAAHDLCSGIVAAHKEHFVAPDCGHYGIFSGRRWREVIYPRLFDFIAKHDLGSTAT
jgi:poly(3-hydroxybutyrate) depolymerase